MIHAISVLFVTRNPDTAGQVIGSIRFRGRAVRPKQAGNQQDLERLLRSHRFDTVVLVDTDLDIGLDDVHSALRQTGCDTPVIVLTHHPESHRLEAIDGGAFAAIGSEHHDLAAAVVLRAVDQLQLHRDLDRLRTLLHEADQRYLLMLDTSRYPIACFHRGRAIYANDAWRERFELPLGESLDGMTLLDVVVPEEKDVLERLLDSREGQPESLETCETLTLQTRRGQAFRTDLVLTGTVIGGNSCSVVHLTTMGAEMVTDFVPAAERSRPAVSSPEPSELESIPILGMQREAVMARADRMTEQESLRRAPAQADDRPEPAEEPWPPEPSTMTSWPQEPSPADTQETRAEPGAILPPGIWPASNEVESGEMTQAASEPRVSEKPASVDPGTPPSVTAADRPQAPQSTDSVWKSRIQDAMANDRLRLLYQPVVSLHGTDIPRYNVFARLKGPEGETYEPGEFVPAAERVGIAAPMDRWIIRHAIATLADQLRRDARTVFFVKLTQGSLDGDPVVDWLKRFLDRYHVPAQNVVAEFRETTVLTHLQTARATARGLTALGVGLCVTDFGNGLDPFQILQQIDAAYIKLDGQFVRDLPRNPASQNTVRDFTHTAHAAGRQVIVPYVEDAETLAVLFGLDVNLVQGYFVHPPAEALDFNFVEGL